VDYLWCTRCNVELDSIPLELTTKRMLGKLRGHVTATGFHEGSLQNAIHALKYDNLSMLAEPLGIRLAETLDRLRLSPDVIVPVPLHRSRQRERGYNQAQLLAEHAARLLNLPYLPHAIQRVRQTRSQVGLNHDERLENMMNAFNANSDTFGSKIVVVIDDVYTTGATLSTCAAAIAKTGAAAVYGLTVTTTRA
jgi:ComF family protein